MREKKRFFREGREEEVYNWFRSFVAGLLIFSIILCWLECSRVANESISILPVRLAPSFDHDLNAACNCKFKHADILTISRPIINISEINERMTIRKTCSFLQFYSYLSSMYAYIFKTRPYSPFIYTYIFNLN